MISTNGGLRSVGWWEELGRVMLRTDSCVELHVDGLRDTNPLYRVHTDFDKIMANARAYMATGARAEWQYILFRHNEHQAEEALALSRELGFSRFVLIDTIRFGKKSRFEYQMPDGSPRALEPASLTSAAFHRRFGGAPAGNGAGNAAGNGAGNAAGSKGGEAATVNGIDCKSARHNRPYITTEGYVAPCCWMAGSGEELAMLDLAGRDREAFNIRNRRLAEILRDEPFVSLYERAWAEDRNAICRRKCGDKVRNTRMAV